MSAAMVEVMQGEVRECGRMKEGRRRRGGGGGDGGGLVWLAWSASCCEVSSWLQGKQKALAFFSAWLHWVQWKPLAGVDAATNLVWKLPYQVLGTGHVGGQLQWEIGYYYAPRLVGNLQVST